MSQVLIAGALGVACLSTAAAQSGHVIYSFLGCADGGGPSSLIQRLGRTYGTNVVGGIPDGPDSSGCGTVFELTENSGAVVESLIWTFLSGSSSDGCNPSSLTPDVSGNLYGTTDGGGIYGGPEFPFAGTAFELSPNRSGWTEKILWNFGAQDGSAPGSLTLDAAGNLYGTTVFNSSSSGCGTVFMLSPNSDGTWSHTVLHTFACNSSDGAFPQAALTLDSSGNVYGITTQGGDYTNCSQGCGTVFELEKASGWTEIQLHMFSGNADGAWPSSPVIFDKSGHLYGTAMSGGINNTGVFFALANISGSWKETVIHAFGASGDGTFPNGGLVASGNRYYGTTATGGRSPACPGGCGTVFEVTQTTSGWTETVLLSFGDKAWDPNVLMFSVGGQLYGTTPYGGAFGWGAVFQMTP